MKAEEKQVPFFARYLEDQKSLEIQTHIKAGGTLKFPSDTDEMDQTHKFPSDSDEE